MSQVAVRPRAIEGKDARCRILLISSPKGGSGKSVLSRHLLVSAAQAGIKVIGLDFDRQQTLTKWAARRARTREAFPDFVEAFVEPVSLGDWRGALQRAEGYELAVLDTPPSVEDHLPAIDGLGEAVAHAGSLRLLQLNFRARRDQ